MTTSMSEEKADALSKKHAKEAVEQWEKDMEATIANIKADNPSDESLWRDCCAREWDDFYREACYIVMQERGYAMPRLMHPAPGDPMPKRAETRA